MWFRKQSPFWIHSISDYASLNFIICSHVHVHFQGIFLHKTEEDEHISLVKNRLLISDSNVTFSTTLIYKSVSIYRFVLNVSLFLLFIFSLKSQVFNLLFTLAWIIRETSDLWALVTHQGYAKWLRIVWTEVSFESGQAFMQKPKCLTAIYKEVVLVTQLNIWMYWETLRRVLTKVNEPVWATFFSACR